MKTRYASILFLLCAWDARAQVVFDLPSAVPSPGYERYSPIFFAFEDLPAVPTAGTGVVWDLTGLEQSGTYMSVFCLDPDSTPHAAGFTGATHAMCFNTPFQETCYKYYTLSGDLLYFNGQVWPENVIPTQQECTEPRLHAVFPFVYQDGWTDPSTCAWDAQASVTATHNIELVATGTILYPGGSIEDVGLVHQVSSGEDYFIWYVMDNILHSVGSYIPSIEQIVVFPLLAIDTTEVDTSEATGMTSVHDHEADARGAISVYPSLAVDDAFVEFHVEANGAGPFGTADAPLVSLISTSGQRIPLRATRTSATRLHLPLGQVAQGSYVVEVRTERGVRHGRVFVVR